MMKVLLLCLYAPSALAGIKEDHTVPLYSNLVVLCCVVCCTGTGRHQGGPHSLPGRERALQWRPHEGRGNGSRYEPHSVDVTPGETASAEWRQ